MGNDGMPVQNIHTYKHQSEQLLPDTMTLLNFNNQPAINLPHTTYDPNTICIMLWANIDALCWLDVLLCALCHSQCIRRAIQSLPFCSVIKKLVLTFDEAQDMIRPLQQGENKLLHSVLDLNDSRVKRGQ